MDGEREETNDLKLEEETTLERDHKSPGSQTSPSWRSIRCRYIKIADDADLLSPSKTIHIPLSFILRIDSKHEKKTLNLLTK